MNRTVMMMLVVSLTLAFAAFLCKDDLGLGKNDQEESQPAASAPHIFQIPLFLFGQEESQPAASAPTPSTEARKTQ